MKLLTILALLGYASAIQIAQENDEEAEFSAWAAKFNRNYKD